MSAAAALVFTALSLPSLEKCVREGRNHKCRLIVYRPRAEKGKEWLGTHADYGVITGLLKPMHDTSSGCDGECGLHVHVRGSGDRLRAEEWLTESDILLQFGESAVCLSDCDPPLLPCVHAVSACGAGSRVQCACFLCPNWDDVLTLPTTDTTLSFWAHAGLPLLSSRFDGEDALTFLQFSQKTTKAYWKKK